MSRTSRAALLANRFGNVRHNGGFRMSPSRSAAVAVAQLAVAGMVALALLSALVVTVIHRVDTRAAVSSARELAIAQARLLVEPTLTDGLVEGDAQSFDNFDAVVRRQLLVGRLARVKLWTDTGRIVYSDDRRLVGRTFALEADDQAVLQTGEAHASVSDLSNAENTFERAEARQLLQVYVRVRAPSGHPLLYETYLRFDPKLAASAALVQSALPAFLLGLLLLELLQLPVAWRLARGWARSQAEHAELRQQAALASENERRRIARDLHDGVVQSLAGVSYTLAAVTERLRPTAGRDVLEQVQTATQAPRHGVAQLRNLISDIHPPAFDPAGLAPAVADLLTGLQQQGVTTKLDIPADIQASPKATAAVYRAAQEAIRNISAHAHATFVAVQVSTSGRWICLCVSDDGIGVHPYSAAIEPRPHLGLHLLETLARDLGGRMTVSALRPTGTTVTFEILR